MKTTDRVLGFIGLGQIGRPLALRLVRAGFKVVVFDKNPDALVDVAELANVSVALSISDLAQRANVVFTCLPNETTIIEVYCEAEGILTNGPTDLISCEISTVTPELAKKIHGLRAAKKGDHFECPVFGGAGDVDAGNAFFALSGNQQKTDLVTPYLLAMGRGYQYVGGSGSASLMKVLQNSLGYGYALLTAEILTLCSSAGGDTKQFVDLVKKAKVMGWSKYFELYAEDLVSGQKSGTGPLQIAAKDTQLLQSIMRDQQFIGPMLAETVRLFELASERGMGKEEFTAVTKLVEEFSHKS